MGDYELDMNMLKNICPIYNDYTIDESTNNASTSTYAFTPIQGEIMLLKDKYFAKVEYGNNYIDQLDSAEKEYFEKKYGPEIYEYLKTKRTAFINSKKKLNCESLLSGDTGAVDIGEADISYLLINIQNDLCNNYVIYNSIDQTDNDAINKFGENTDVIMDELKNLYSKSDLEERKIEYRQEELNNINYYNNLITIFYFFVLITYFIYLLINNNLNIGKSWFIYIILIMFPVYIYPFLFHYIKKLFNYLSLNMELHGPKNAFINQDINFGFL